MSDFDSILEYRTINGTFVELMESFAEEPACEVEGHGDPSHVLYHRHDTGGPRWKETFTCPTCNESLQLLVCESFHNFITEMMAVPEHANVPDLMLCDDCNSSWSLAECYKGGVRWG